MNLRERLKYVVDQGWVKSANRWSLDATLSKGMVSHIINGRSDDPKRGTLLKLARAAKLSPAWLIDEVGSPRDPEPETFDAYPSRRAVVEMLRSDPSVSETAIQRLRAVDIYTDDPGLKEWVRLALRFMEDEERLADRPGPERKSRPNA